MQEDEVYVNICSHRHFNFPFVSRFFSLVDAILIPTPFYGVITEDVRFYSDVKLFHVPLDSEVRIHNWI